MPDELDLISLQEAASLLGVSTSTLRNWDNNGRLPAVRNPKNNYRRYRLMDVLSLQEEPSLYNPADVVDEVSQQHLTRSDLRRLIGNLHRILRDAEGNSSLVERFDEITKLLYLRAYAERGSTEESAFGLVDFEAVDVVAERLKEQFRELVARKPGLIPDRFAQLRARNQTLHSLASVLSSVHITGRGHDVKGLAYEEVVRNTFEKGDNQQFFTPRHIVDFMVSLAGDYLGEIICDPACGTGGFLLRVAEEIRRRNRKSFELVGAEIDERLAWSARLNLDMHGIENFDVRHLQGAGSLGQGLSDIVGQVDLILTNPPFGSELTDRRILDRFEVGVGQPSVRRGILFIERCLDLLRPGGVVGIIIDEGVLNGRSKDSIRRLILERADVLAVVSLPEVAFMPYASIQTSILLLRKHGAPDTLKGRTSTFFARAEDVGRRPSGDTAYKYREDGKRELDSDLPSIARAWHESESSPEQVMREPLCFWKNLRASKAKDTPFASHGFRLDVTFHHPARSVAESALASSSYPLAKLRDLCEIRNQAVIPSKDLRGEEIQFVGLGNIEPRTGRAIPESIFASSLKSSVRRFTAGDILFARMRPELRKVWFVPRDVHEGFASGECIVLIPRVKGSEYVMLPELLSLLLRSDLAFGQIMHLVTGMARPRISKSAVLNIKLPLPPRADQEAFLDEFQRREETAVDLVEQSSRLVAQAEVLRTSAAARLVSSVLSGGPQ